jgi:hypothetical protein
MEEICLHKQMEEICLHKQMEIIEEITEGIVGKVVNGEVEEEVAILMKVLKIEDSEEVEEEAVVKKTTMDTEEEKYGAVEKEAMIKTKTKIILLLIKF